ncbi:MAG: hypothetical protein WKF84_08315 [Pyrinomonadaceae bacterium]
MLGETNSSKLVEQKHSRREAFGHACLSWANIASKALLTYEQLFQQWIAAAEKQNAANV